jgi:hypothetical protein
MQAGHYTSAAALIGIFENEKLWATNIKFLNDEQEFLHALDLARAVTQESQQRFNKKSGFLESHALYVKDITAQLESLNTYQNPYSLALFLSRRTCFLNGEGIAPEIKVTALNLMSMKFIPQRRMNLTTLNYLPASTTTKQKPNKYTQF